MAHYRDAERYYRVPLTAPWARLALGGALAALLLFLAPKVWRHSQAERLVQKATLESIQRAIALEPDRAEYRDMLGRVYLFSLTSYDPKLAADSLQRAVQLNPAVAEYWLDLATAYDSLGRKKDSVECVETARRHDPLNPKIAWSTGNIRAEAGDIPGALDAWRDAIEGDSTKTGVGLDLGWKLAGDTKVLLDHLVPRTNEADLAFLDYLCERHIGKPELVWDRMIARGQPFPPKRATNYFYWLLLTSPESERRSNVETAKKVWRQLLHMIASSSAVDGEGAPILEGESGHALRVSGGGNLINNPGFESTMLNMGFDWTWSSPKGALLVLDESVVKDGRRSARIDFDGTQSMIFAGLGQMVPVEPGHRYRLTSNLRGERIQGGAGIRLEVVDARVDEIAVPIAHGQEVFQTDGWVSDSFDFTAPPKIYLIAVRVQRNLRGAITSKLSGVFWLDNVVLRDLDSPASTSAPTKGRAPSGSSAPQGEP